jgi:AraC-like DNA-binding protein
MSQPERSDAVVKVHACNQFSLVENALSTGLGSQASFTRVFLDVVGITPGQYREQCLR